MEIPVGSLKFMVYTLAIQSLVPRLIISHHFRALLEMQNLEPYPRPTELEPAF